MKKSDFFYDLPDYLIAQTPLEPRDSSKLLVLDRKTGELSHNHFYEISNYLNSGDLLVLNSSKVIPARIFGKKIDTGSNIEILVLEQKSNDIWEILVKPGKRAKIGTTISFGDGILTGEIIDIKIDGSRLIKFSYNGVLFDILDDIGTMPLPPYITKKLNDKSRYQTVYSKELGSSAAPTAGLHFTKELLDKIKQKGVNIVDITLHVGLGTFRPVKEDDISNHTMHSEYFTLPHETAKLINETKKNGKKVIAVGTTSCRTLESVATFYDEIKEVSGKTDIFICPGYDFKVIDGLITNFHLPESTLIMLVSAFCGKENTMNAYKSAILNEYRFFSFGDAMIII